MTRSYICTRWDLQRNHEHAVSARLEVQFPASGDQPKYKWVSNVGSPKCLEPSQIANTLWVHILICMFCCTVCHALCQASFVHCVKENDILGGANSRLSVRIHVGIDLHKLRCNIITHCQNGGKLCTPPCHVSAHKASALCLSRRWKVYIQSHNTKTDSKYWITKPNTW